MEKTRNRAILGTMKYVHKKGPSLYYVRNNKWIWLCPADTPEHEIRAAVWKIQVRGERLVRDIMDDYRKARLPKLAMTTQRDYESILKALKPVFGHMRPGDITSQDIAVYLEGRDRQGHGSRANREVAVLSSVFNHGMRTRACMLNPCYGVRRNKESKRTHYVSNEDLRKAMKAAGPGFRHLMWAAYLTGLRRGDLSRLTEANLTPEGIKVHQSKDGKHILVLWSDSLRRVVRRGLQRTRSGYVFSNERGHRYTVSAMDNALRRMKAQAGVNWRFHDIRAKAESDSKSGLGLLARYDRAKRLKAVK